jgi:hypothetical protein
MKNNRSVVSASLAVVLALGMTPLLAGCFMPLQSLVQQGAEQAAENATGGDVDLNLDGSGASLPADWPAEVPVIDGEIEASVRLGEGSETTWSVTVTIVSVTEAWATIKSDFEAAGFVSDFESVSSEGTLGSFSNGTHSAIVTLADDGSGNATATYVVSLVATQ